MVVRPYRNADQQIRRTHVSPTLRIVLPGSPTRRIIALGTYRVQSTSRHCTSCVLHTHSSYGVFQRLWIFQSSTHERLFFTASPKSRHAVICLKNLHTWILLPVYISSNDACILCALGNPLINHQSCSWYIWPPTKPSLPDFLQMVHHHNNTSDDRSFCSPCSKRRSFNPPAAGNFCHRLLVLCTEYRNNSCWSTEKATSSALSVQRPIHACSHIASC